MRRDFNAFVRAVSDKWGWPLVAVKGLLLCLRPAVESAAGCTPTVVISSGARLAFAPSSKCVFLSSPPPPAVREVRAARTVRHCARD